MSYRMSAPFVIRKALTALVIIFACIGLLFTAVFLGMRLGIFNVRGSIDERNRFFLTSVDTSDSKTLHEPCTDMRDVCRWNETPEWLVVGGGLQKDASVITRVAGETGVPARLIAAVVVPEQLRFFTAEREVYKRYFEPLKILASLSQFSLGVSGIKQETAEAIERHAIDAQSPFYPGERYGAFMAYQDGPSDRKEELYNRLTDPKDHYYSYLYTAIYIREVSEQWRKAGYDIADNPEIVATLFNLGFGASKPNVAPRAGGAAITVGGTTYSYGELAGEFWRSEELADVFAK